MDLVTLVLGVGAVTVNDRPAMAGEPPCLVVLVDPEPDEWDAALASGAPVVLVSGNSLEPDAVTEAVLRGADAVVHADSHLDELRDAMRVLQGGGTLLDPCQTRALAVAARSKGGGSGVEITLTTRERQILASIERGEVVKQTAIALGISAKTVENLQGRLFCKLGARNRAQAVTRAYELGLLDRPPHA